MWAEVKADQVIKVHHRPRALTVNGIQHPSGIFSKWTKEKLAEIGMFPYVIQKTGDIRFQKEGSVEYKIESDKVIGKFDIQNIFHGGTFVVHAGVCCC